MFKKIITITCVISLSGVLVFTFGCEKQDELPSEPATVKSFKIEKPDKHGEAVKPDEAVKTEPLNGDAQTQTESNKEEGLVDVVEPDENIAAPEPVVEEVGDEKEKTDVVSPESLEKADVPASESAVDSDKNLSETMDPAITLPGVVIDEEKDDVSKGYNPKGRIDPFEPLFQAKGEATVSDTPGRTYQTIRDSRRGKLTALEKLDISQLKLSAIILTSNRNIAMVQESTGKGHVVKKGTYIGINSGRVVEIKKNAIIIEEEVEDFLGKIVVRKRELKLQKPLGER